MKYWKRLFYGAVPLGLFLYGVIGVGAYTGTALVAAYVMYGILVVTSLTLPYLPPAVVFEDRMDLPRLRATMGILTHAYDRRYRRFVISLDMITIAVMGYYG